MDPAVATLDFAKAGAIIADMIESYLAGGAPPSNPEGDDHDDLQDCRSTPHDDDLTATTPKSRSPVWSLLSPPRLSSLQRCVHHATAAPIFNNIPASTSEKRLAPELQRHPHPSADLAANLNCGPHTAKPP